MQIFFFMNETEILLVEDNEGDVILTLEIFNELMLLNKINVVKDGEQAIRYLNKQKELGFDKVLAFQQTKYEENKKKLGM